jgi:plastocyanin
MLAIGLLLTGCASTTQPSGTPVSIAASASAAATPVTVKMPLNADNVPIFSQQELTVSVGDTVTFENDSTIPHTVTEGQDGEAAADAQFDEDVPPGESVEITFEEAGDVNVTCKLHPEMNMVVHVL